MGKYHWRSFEDFASEATIVSQALRNLGLNPRDKVGILAETRAEWILTAYACFKNNITIVTIYTNLGNDGIVHALNETEVPLLVCSDETLPKVAAVYGQRQLIAQENLDENGTGPSTIGASERWCTYIIQVLSMYVHNESK